MAPIPRWLTDMGEAGQIPVMLAEGDDAGAISYLPAEKVAAAVRAGTHVSLEGRDMTTFDLAAERAKRPWRNRALRSDPPKEPPEPAEPPPEKPGEPEPTEAERTARVGRYSNRALVTKPGERN